MNAIGTTHVTQKELLTSVILVNEHDLWQIEFTIRYYQHKVNDSTKVPTSKYNRHFILKYNLKFRTNMQNFKYLFKQNVYFI